MDSNQSRIPIATKVITPDTRCRMEAIAVIGKWMVCKSKLTGLYARGFQTKLAQAYNEIKDLREALTMTQEAVDKDSLTGLFNRGKFDNMQNSRPGHYRPHSNHNLAIYYVGFHPANRSQSSQTVPK